MSDPYLKGNKAGNRPHYYCFEDTNMGIYWMIAGKLIEAANEYARAVGFDKTYIPSEHIGLYEKYGYHYLKDIVNYGNGTDRLYVKELLSR